MSPLREGMSGWTAKVKPGSALAPQGPGGRFRGTYALGPLVNTTGRWCASASTRLQHLGDSEVLLFRDRAIPRVFLARGGGPRKGRVSPKTGTTEISSSGARRRPCSSLSPSCHVQRERTTAHITDDVGSRGPGKTWLSPLDPTVSHCDCARVWNGRYSEALQPRRRDPASSPRNPGGRGRIPHSNSRSERLDTKGTWSSLTRLAEARANRKTVDWVTKCASDDCKGLYGACVKPRRMRGKSYRGGRNISG